MKKFNTFLSEQPEVISEAPVALRPAELKKPNGKTGESRIEILRKATIAGTPLVTTDLKTVEIANTHDNLERIAKFADDQKPITLITKTGEEITSSQLAKTALFGGGGGAGGGTDNTAVTEAAQCLWLAAMLKHGIQDIEYYTPDVLKGVMSRVDVGKTTFKEMMDIDSSWQYSSYESAKKIIKAGYVNPKHRFHRGSPGMIAIYATKTRAFKNSELKVLSDDKWNPGDIWAVESPTYIKDSLDDSSVAALNNSILSLFLDRKLVGISLKKVTKEAKIKEYNISSSLTPHKLVSVAVKSRTRGDFFSNKSGTITYDDGIMDIRPNSYLGTNKIEIKGKTARGGGAGWGVVVEAARRYMGANIPLHPVIKKAATKIAKGDKRETQRFFIKAKVCDQSLTYDYFLEQIEQKDAGWVSAKLGAIEVCYALIKNKGTKADNFVNSIVNYAASKSEDSSAFIKVYQ